MGWRDYTNRDREPAYRGGNDMGAVLSQLRRMESKMATRAELDKINAAIANLTTQVGAVVESIKQNSDAARKAHDAEDDTALESALTNINAQADALAAVVAPAAAAAAAATPQG